MGNEEHESLAPKYIPTPDDEFSREDVLWDPNFILTPDNDDLEKRNPESERKRYLMSELGKFWNEIKGLPKEERLESIQREYGDNPEILEILKQILAEKDVHQDNLERKLNVWKIKSRVSKEGDVNEWYRKDIETPDENRHQSQASSGLLQAFFESFGSFQDPATGQAPNVTIADFYKMVQGLTDVMQEIQNEKDTRDSIEEQVLSFLNGLTANIKLLNKSQQAMNIQEYLKPNDIEKVQRLWDDYVNNVYAKVQQSLKEEGLAPLSNAPLTYKEKDKM